MSMSKPSTPKTKYEEDIASRDFKTVFEEHILFTHQNTSKPDCEICVVVPKNI